MLGNIEMVKVSNGQEPYPVLGIIEMEKVSNDQELLH